MDPIRIDNRDNTIDIWGKRTEYEHENANQSQRSTSKQTEIRNLREIEFKLMQLIKSNKNNLVPVIPVSI